MTSFYLTLILIRIALGNSDNEISPETINNLKEEFGANWEDILHPEYTCCPVYTDEASCNAEAGSNCVWFENPNHPIAQAGQAQCLGKAYVKCKRRLGVEFKCAPTFACGPCPVSRCFGCQRGFCAWGTCSPTAPTPIPPLICGPAHDSANDLAINQPKQLILSNYGESRMDHIVMSTLAAIIFILSCLVGMYLYRQRRKKQPDLEYMELKDETGRIDDEEEELEDCAEIITFLRSHCNRACNQ